MLPSMRYQIPFQMKLALLLIALPAAVLSQNAGTQKQEQPLPIKWSECTAPGSCTQKVGI